MAQKTEKEDTEFKVVSETITPCVSNCGPSTSSGGVKFGEKSPRSSSGKWPPLERTADRAETRRDLNDDAKVPFDRIPVVRREVNRCSGCRRKVGLTGFRCRCGDLFCADHRYSDRHECSYDYKAAGREAIARENPVVKAAKIVKL